MVSVPESLLLWEKVAAKPTDEAFYIRAAGISHTAYISQIRRIYIAGCVAVGFCVAVRLLGASRRPRPTTVAAYIYGFGIRQPSLGGRGRLPSSEGEMSAKPTEGYGSVRPRSGG